MRKRPLIVVEWDDISSYSSWGIEKESKDWTPLRCVSVGWKMPSGKKHLTMASTRSEGKQCTDRQVIPKGCIIKIRRLE